MSSITSMQYAIRKSESRWERETAERILRIREKYGSDSKEYGDIKESFYCYGCYLKWKEVHGNEPDKREIPLLTHVDNTKIGGTYFRLRHLNEKNEKNKHNEGCCFNDPTVHLKSISNSFDYMDVDTKGVSHLTILKKNQPKGAKNNRFSTGKRDSTERKRYQSFGALQEIYNRYNNAWTELTVRTEDSKNVKIKDILFSSSEAIKIAQNHQEDILIVTGVIKKVENRNNGGFINIIFKEKENTPFSSFRLSVSPDHIYNEGDLKCLENRNIGCYGRTRYNKTFAQMELFSLPNQIVFFDLKENEPCPFTPPVIDLKRMETTLTDTFTAYKAVATTANAEDFSYYLKNQKNIPLLEKQIEQNIMKREELLQEKEHRLKVRDRNVNEKERLIVQLNNKKDELKTIKNTLEKKSSFMERVLDIFKINESKKINSLLSQKEIAEEEINDLKQEFYVKSNNVVDTENFIKHIESNAVDIQTRVSTTLQVMDDLKQGLKVEKVWREVVEKENCYMYHISSSSLWIAVQISKAVYNSSIMEIKCLFQSHYEDNEMRFHPQKIQSIEFNISSNELMIYQKIRNELNNRLRHLPFLRKMKITKKTIINS
ncbi:hypothetical protein [Priestia megaterium]|uniref:hypothetical protein n=1 Tax=Priestia megaterium TaxID=1404 RepID=UPI001C53039B|nr:hypothetical protein [Priestia megaterium]MBW0933473.1 hypothetical protein [Priestia megaterium]